MTLDDYKLVLYRKQPDGWVAEVPSIPGCYALMATRDEALAELAGVFQTIVAEYSVRGQPLPKDTTEILVGKSSGKSIADALREFWRAHRVTMAREIGRATTCTTARNPLIFGGGVRGSANARYSGRKGQEAENARSVRRLWQKSLRMQIPSPKAKAGIGSNARYAA